MREMIHRGSGPRTRGFVRFPFQRSEQDDASNENYTKKTLLSPKTMVCNEVSQRDEQAFLEGVHDQQKAVKPGDVNLGKIRRIVHKKSEASPSRRLASPVF